MYRDFLLRRLLGNQPQPPAAPPVDSVAAGMARAQQAFAALDRARAAAGGGAPVVANDALGQTGPVVVGPAYGAAVQPGVRAGRPVAVGLPPNVPVAGPVLDPQAAARAAAAQRVAQGLASGPETGGGDTYARMVAAGATPEQAAQIALQERTSQAAEQQRIRAQTELANAGGTDPVLSGITQAVTDPIGTVNDAARFAVEDVLGGSIRAATNIPGPVGSAISAAVDASQVPYAANTNRIGDEIYKTANGQNAGLVLPWVGQTSLPDPYLELGQLRTFASNPERFTDGAGNPLSKDAINAAYTVGFDLNDDGVVDVKGGDAVFLLYNAATGEGDGFITQMIDQTAFDPLFLLPVVGGAGKAVGEGAAVGAEAAAVGGTARQAAVFGALARAMRTVEAASAGANRVANLPFEAPLVAGRAALRGVGALGEAGARIARGISWLGEPAAETAAHDAANASIDVVNAVTRAEAVPAYGTNPAGLPTVPTPDPVPPGLPPGPVPVPREPTPRLPSPAGEPIPVAAGDVPPRVARSTVGGLPRWQIGEDVRVRTIPGKGYVVEQKGGNGRYGRTGLYVDQQAAVDAGIAVAKGIPAPTPAALAEAANPLPGTPAPEAVAAPPATAAVPDRPAAAVAEDATGDGLGSAAAPAPPPDANPARPRLITEELTPEQRNALIKAERAKPIAERRVTQLTPIPGGTRLVDQAWDRQFADPAGWNRFLAEYKPRGDRYLEQADALDAAWFPDLREKQARQVVGGIEHTVDDVSPAFLAAFGDLPETPVTGRKTAATPSGKASFVDERLPYLFQRYVYTPDAKEAARIVEVLRKRPDFGAAPYAAEVLDRLQAARGRETALRARAGIAPEPPPVRADLAQRVADAKAAALPPPEAAALPNDTDVLPASVAANPDQLIRNLSQADVEFIRQGVRDGSIYGRTKDRYRETGADRFSYVDARGEERSAYRYAPDRFVQSDASGALVRYYIELPSGKIIHPDEVQRVLDLRAGRAPVDKRDAAAAQKIVTGIDRGEVDEVAKGIAARRTPAYQRVVDRQTKVAERQGVTRERLVRDSEMARAEADQAFRAGRAEVEASGAWQDARDDAFAQIARREFNAAKVAVPPEYAAADAAAAAGADAPPAAGLSDYTTTTLDNLRTDTERFQNRRADFSEESARRVDQAYDPNRFDPIEVADNGDGTYTILSGHSRYEGLRRRQTRGAMAADAPVPIAIRRGTTEELQRLAQTSNVRGTPNTPVEKGRLLQRLMDEGLSRDEALRQANVGGSAEAGRLLNLTNLGPELQDAVDAGRLSVPQGSLLGDAIAKGTLTPSEATALYHNTIAAKGMADADLRDYLATAGRIKAAANVNQGGLFGGFDLGDSGFAARSERMIALGRKVRALQTESRALARSAGSAYVDDAGRESLRRGTEALRADVAALERELGIPAAAPEPGRGRPQAAGMGEVARFEPETTPVAASRVPAGRGVEFAADGQVLASGMGDGDVVVVVSGRTAPNHPEYFRADAVIAGQQELGSYRRTIEEAQADAKRFVARSRKRAREGSSEFRVGEVRDDGGYRLTAEVDGPTGRIKVAASKARKDDPRPRKADPVWSVVEERLGSTGIAGYTPTTRSTVISGLTFADAVEAAKRYLTRGQAADFVAPGTTEVMALVDRVDALATRVLGPSTAEVAVSENIPLPGSLGEAERFGALTEPSIQAARGEIPADVAAYLDQPIRVHEARLTKSGKPGRGGTWTAVSPDEARRIAALADETIPGGGTWTGAQVRVREMTQADLLTATAQALPADATARELASAYADAVALQTGAPPPRRVAMWAPLERVRRVVGTINSMAGSIAIHNLATGWRGLANDFFGDNLRAALSGNLSAAIVGSNPLEYLRELQRRPSEAALRADAYGRDLPAALTENHQRADVGGSAATGRTPTNKAVSRVLGQAAGSSGDRIVGAVTELVDSRRMRDWRQVGDRVKRDAIFVNELDKREGATARAFRERARGWGERNGILPSSVDAYLSDLGDRFSPQQVRAAMGELADDAGLAPDAAVNFADALAKDWSARVDEVMAAADAEQNRVMFSYRRTNADQLFGKFLLYHYWMSRAIPAYLRIAVTNPWTGAMWVRGWREIEARREREGYPPGLKGFIRFAGSTAGTYMLWDPMNVLMPLADMAPSDTADGRWETITQFVVANPALRTAASLMGWTDQLADPLMTNSVRGMAMGFVNAVRAANGQTPATDPYETLLAKTEGLVNRVMAQIGAPTAVEQTFSRPGTATVLNIRTRVAENLEAELGVPREQWGAAEWQRWVDIVNAGEAGQESPEYQAAFEAQANAELEGKVINGLVPGGVRVRYGPRDELLTGDLTDDEQTAKRYITAGSAQDAQLEAWGQAYDELGTDRQRQLAAGYGDILNPDRVPPDSVLTIGGRLYTAGSVAALTPEERKALAKAWVASYDGTDELSAYWAERSAFAEAHPEFGAFTDWRKAAFDYRGGPRQFRLDRAKGNPNFKRQMEDYAAYLRENGTDPALIETELDQWATGMAAYKAAAGVRDSVYAAEPTDTGDQATVDTIQRSQTASAGTPTYGGKKSTLENLTADLTAYEAGMASVTKLAGQYGIGPAALESSDPYLVQAMGAMFGALLPRKSTLQKQYEAWAAVQPPGYDASPAAFAAWLDALAQDRAA